MKTRKFSKLDLDLYEEKLDNGFRIYVVPMKVSSVYTTLSTKYGSCENEFIPYGGNEYVKVPDGIAHFLEHKVFEQKDGDDPFEFFAKHGASANANTTYEKTTYLFSGINNFKENIKYLLDYVYSPYFTDENVEKEKGIIEQEVKMYEDDPYSALIENIVCNTFKNHPMKTKVIGDIESIYSITKEDLYKCYNTFYQPSNMFLVVTGNVKPNEVFTSVKKYFKNKKMYKPFEVKVKECVEPKEVAKKAETIKLNVNIPKVGVGYKISLNDIKMDIFKKIAYINLYFYLQTDETSILNEELTDKGYITDYLASTSVKTKDYLCLYILAETKKTAKVIDAIKKSVASRKITKADFERKKHAIIADLIKGSDSIYAINNKIMSNIIDRDDVDLNTYDFIEKLTYSEFKKCVDKINLENNLTYIIKPN